ncbi:MAG: hypothetical protein J7527_01170 [Chitinophagaceae bacterium]|nr:hypothetical protein [Chitinophagaceae bacterium]
MKQLFIFMFCVVLIALTACAKKKVMSYNETASLMKPSLEFNPMEGKLISSGIDSLHHTMYTLYGNEIAVNHARYHSETCYPAGSILSKIVWKQQPDPVWFGGNIPSSVVSIEVVRLRTNTDGLLQAAYQHYAGDGTGADAVISPEEAELLAAKIMSVRASVMP